MPRNFLVKRHGLHYLYFKCWFRVKEDVTSRRKVKSRVLNIIAVWREDFGTKYGDAFRRRKEPYYVYEEQHEDGSKGKEEALL